MNVFIRRYDDEFQWYVTSSEAVKSEVHQGSLEDLGEYYRLFETVENWILVAPAIDTAYRTIEFTEKEKKHINKALPYLLEEDLLTEADDLHYVSDKPAATSVAHHPANARRCLFLSLLPRNRLRFASLLPRSARPRPPHSRPAVTLDQFDGPA